MTWLSHGTSRGLFTPNFFLAGYKDLLAWAAFNKISSCSPNHSKQLPSRRCDIEGERRGLGGEANPAESRTGQGRGRVDKASRGGDSTFEELREALPTLELDKGSSLQLAGNLNT